jgi:hypothetical protein
MISDDLFQFDLAIAHHLSLGMVSATSSAEPVLVELGADGMNTYADGFIFLAEDTALARVWRGIVLGHLPRSSGKRAAPICGRRISIAPPFGRVCPEHTNQLENAIELRQFVNLRQAIISENLFRLSAQPDRMFRMKQIYAANGSIARISSRALSPMARRRGPAYRV